MSSGSFNVAFELEGLTRAILNQSVGIQYRYVGVQLSGQLNGPLQCLVGRLGEVDRTQDAIGSRILRGVCHSTNVMFRIAGGGNFDQQGN